MLRRRRPIVVSTLLGCLSGASWLAACAMDSETASLGDPPATGAEAEAGTVGAASLIAVHASYDFPAFRICVEGLDTLPPLPDTKTMPRSNLVGVDIGNAVHLGSLTTPAPIAPSGEGGVSDAGADAHASDSGSSHTGDAGTANDAGDAAFDPDASDDAGFDAGLGGDAGEDGGVDAGARDAAPPGRSRRVYVIDEAALRGKSGSCAELLPSVPEQSMATLPLEEGDADDLFRGGVGVLALTGCRAGVVLDEAAALRACGSDYKRDGGNLKITAVPARYQDRFEGGFYAQLLTLSPSLGNAKVTFSQVVGEATMAAEELGPAPPYRLLGPSAPVAVRFRGEESDFGRFGFRIIDQTAPSMPKVLREQTLAEISAFTDPRILPTAFYALPSNFVVLLIGNADDVERNVDPGRKLHMVAVPLRDPDARSTNDAGSEPTP